MFSSEDLERVVRKIQKLHRFSGVRDRVVYPILRLGYGFSIRGLPISVDNFRVFEPKSHDLYVLSVDASLKTLFDCSTYRVVLAKVSIGIWRGRQRVFSLPSPIVRLGIVPSREAAFEWLFRVEIRSLLDVLGDLSSCKVDILLLDRSLVCPPVFSEKTRSLFLKFINFVRDKLQASVVGLSKSSQLRLCTGEPLIGYLLLLSNSVEELRGKCWIYYPVFSRGALPPWYFGDIAIVKFDPHSEHAFRLDFTLSMVNLDDIVSYLAYLLDPVTLGYPYPLRCVHEESRISRSEVELARLRLLDELKKFGLFNYFISDLRSSTFREKYLFGRVGIV